MQVCSPLFGGAFRKASLVISPSSLQGLRSGLNWFFSFWTNWNKQLISAMIWTTTLKLHRKYWTNSLTLALFVSTALHSNIVLIHCSFMWQMCSYLPTTLPRSDPEQRVSIMAAILSASFILETLIHAKEKVYNAMHIIVWCNFSYTSILVP